MEGRTEKKKNGGKKPNSSTPSRPRLNPPRKWPSEGQGRPHGSGAALATAGAFCVRDSTKRGGAEGCRARRGDVASRLPPRAVRRFSPLVLLPTSWWHANKGIKIPTESAKRSTSATSRAENGQSLVSTANNWGSCYLKYLSIFGCSGMLHSFPNDSLAIFEGKSNYHFSLS